MKINNESIMKYEPQEITFEQAVANAKNNIRPEGLYYYHTPYVKNSIWIMNSKIYGITFVTIVVYSDYSFTFSWLIDNYLLAYCLLSFSRKPSTIPLTAWVGMAVLYFMSISHGFCKYEIYKHLIDANLIYAADISGFQNKGINPINDYIYHKNNIQVFMFMVVLRYLLCKIGYRRIYKIYHKSGLIIRSSMRKLHKFLNNHA